MTFFFDNNLSPKYVAALKALGENVVHLKDHFPADAKDEDWIPRIGANGWTLVTFDKRIRRNHGQRVVLEQAQITSFMLAERVAQLVSWQQVVWLFSRWEEIRTIRGRTSGAVTYRVPVRGKIEVWK